MKKPNIKGLLVDHGEKIALGVVGLIVLLVLSGTNWARTDKNPDEIIRKAEDARKKIDAAQWPEDEKQKHQVISFLTAAQQLARPLATASAYDFSTPLFHPLYRKQELIKEPEWLPVTDLIATAGTAILSVPANPTSTSLASTTDATGATATTEPMSELDPEFATRGPMAAGTDPLATNPFAPGSTTEMSPYSTDPAMMSGEGMGSTSSVASRGVRYVAVRGIYPLRQQLDRLQRALNLQTKQEAIDLFYDQELLVDFVLERQAAVPGPDPWSGKWEKVDVEGDLTIIAEGNDFEPDPVAEEIHNPVITGPLAPRLRGFWAEAATHPKVRNFQLSPAEQAKIMKRQEQILEEFNKQKLQQQGRALKGFAGVQANIRGMTNQLLSSEGADESLRNMSTSLSGSTGQRMTVADLKSQLTAGGHLLLFRYFDFHVEPGMAYRYRVKLELFNPNYERPIEQIADKSIAQGQTRETPWSNISNPTVVPDTVKYFVKDVGRDPARDLARSSRKPIADIQVFQWDTALGTMLADVVRVTSIGQVLAEKRKTPRLDVAKPEFKTEEVTLGSGDILVDAAGDIEFGSDSKHVKELALKPEQKGKLDLAAEVVVIDPNGELDLYDSKTKSAEEKAIQRYVAMERKEYEAILDQEQQPMNSLDMMGTDGMPIDPKARNNRRQRNPLKQGAMRGSRAMGSSASRGP